MSKQLRLTLNDAQQAVLKEIVDLQNKHLKGTDTTERQVLAAALDTGLRKDLRTLRRFSSLANRLQG